MATKLKDLTVTKVDFVDQGANPDAYICLFKRKDGEHIEKKDAKLFTATLEKEERREQAGTVFDYCYALADSLTSIIMDDDLTPDARSTMADQSIKEFSETLKNAGVFTGGKAPDGIQKSVEMEQARLAFLTKRGLTDTLKEKEEHDTMKIDKSKMTPEEAAMLESFEKKYGIADEPAPAAPTNGNAADGVAKGAPAPEPAAPEPTPTAPDGNADVRKALTDMQEAYSKQTKEVEELRKRLEMEQLTQVAKKYEILGKNQTELVQKLYDYRKAGGTIYDDYIALLDQNLDLVNKSHMFSEIGTSRQGDMNSEGMLNAKAAEIAKSTAGISQAEAIARAFEQNPELAAQYEQEYRR